MAEEREEMPTKAEVKRDALMVLGAPIHGGLIPQNFEAMWRMAQIMAASGMMPKGLETPEAVFVAVQMGLEVGLSPMQAVQNIAVINGRPSVWGDAGLALVEASGLLEDFIEEISDHSARCVAKRKGRPSTIEREFSMDDARRAGLIGKGVWAQYPKRMLQMRARWWVLRDGFADVLKGLKSAEEIMDMEADMGGAYIAKTETEQRTEELKERLQKQQRKDAQPIEVDHTAPPPASNSPGDFSEADEFWNLKAGGWLEYYQTMTKEKFDSWSQETQQKFLRKCKVMSTRANIPSPWPPTTTVTVEPELESEPEPKPTPEVHSRPPAVMLQEEILREVYHMRKTDPTLYGEIVNGRKSAALWSPAEFEEVRAEFSRRLDEKLAMEGE
jgi:hypothetical protein